MKQYLEMMKDVRDTGDVVMDRTGVGTISKIGKMVQFDMADGFPAVTTKRLALRAVIGELIWFMSGMTNVEQLRDITHGVGSDKKTIWDDNYENQGRALGYTGGYLGPVYGAQWRDFNNEGIDQLKWVINRIKTNPECRRLIVSAWNPAEIDEMALPPCHVLFKFHVRNGRLGLTWFQRSADLFLGVAFNIASYATLLHIVARMTGYEPGLLTGYFDDAHVYMNHVEQVQIQLEREPRKLPELKIHYNINTTTDLDVMLAEIKVSDFELVGYDPHPAIPAPMAV
jgi:thymidylate synthase